MALQVKFLSFWIVAILPAVGVAASGSDLRLVEAIKKQDKAAVQGLLKQHVDVNATEAEGTTALAWAAHWNDLNTADLLILAGANVNTVSDYGASPLWEACNNGSAPMVDKLLKSGADLNVPFLGTGETALMRCARTGSADAVKSLLAHGADANAKEKQRGQTALMWAIEERHPESAQALIEHGADINAKSKGGFTPLLFAARQGDIKSGRLLVEKGADVNQAGPGGLSVLLLAIDSGHEDFSVFLVEKGANPNAADPDGATALHYSIRQGISLLRAGSRNSNNGNQDYLFRPNMPVLVKALLDHGANPNARISKVIRRMGVNDRPMLNLTGATPFLVAAATGDSGIMRTMLAKGADPNLATNDNTTPLMVAAGVGRWDDRTKEQHNQALEAVKLLVEHGADLNAASKDLATNIPGGGMTALHGAAFAGSDEIVQYLVEKGAKIDSKDFFGMTPLSIADGDPAGLLPDFIEGKAHPSTAALIRKLIAKGQGPSASLSTPTAQ